MNNLFSWVLLNWEKSERNLIKAESFLADSLSEAFREHYKIDHVVYLDSLASSSIHDTECSAKSNDKWFVATYLQSNQQRENL